jgi:hypothetical protein
MAMYGSKIRSRGNIKEIGDEGLGRDEREAKVITNVQVKQSTSPLPL